MRKTSTLLATTGVIVALAAAVQASDERGAKGGWGKPATATKAEARGPVAPAPARTRRAQRPRAAAEAAAKVRLEWPARPEIRLSWDTAAPEGLPAVALDWNTGRAQ